MMKIKELQLKKEGKQHCADKDGRGLYFNNLVSKINEFQLLKKLNLHFDKILSYDDKILKEGEKYENLGVAKILTEAFGKVKQNTYLISNRATSFDKLRVTEFSLPNPKHSDDLRTIGSFGLTNFVLTHKFGFVI